MKQITKNTILKQRDKTFQPIEVDGVVFWYEEDDFKKHYPKAQSQLRFERIPVIGLDSYVEILADKCVTTNAGNRTINEDGWMSTGFVYGFKSNPNQYTQKDIEKAIKFTRGSNEPMEEILEQINYISVIEVDEHFNIISYE